MRILLLTWEYPPYVVGGMGKHVAGLIPALGKLRAEFDDLQVDVVTTRYAGGPAIETVAEGVTLHRVETHPLDPLDLYHSVIECNQEFVSYAHKLASDQPFDLVHIHDWLTGVAGVSLKFAYKTPLVATIHATERGRHQGHLPSSTSHQIDALERHICNEAWRVIVCSRFMADEVKGYFGVPFDKISVIPNGVDCPVPAVNICPPATRRQLRAAYAPNDERLLFFVGRSVHEKGLHVLIQAMPAILCDAPNTRLLVAGKNSRHHYPLALGLGVEHAVTFLDFISDQQRDWLYQIADVAIFPSLYEPFGIVALEAMALNCNVIASDVGGLGEVVKHLHNGLTVYPNDPASIAWAVREMFRDPAAAARRRAHALVDVQMYYNWQGIARQTAALFARVVQERAVTVW